MQWNVRIEDLNGEAVIVFPLEVAEKLNVLGADSIEIEELDDGFRLLPNPVCTDSR